MTQTLTAKLLAIVALGAAAALHAPAQQPLGKFQREINDLRGPTAVVFLDEDSLLVVESEADCITRIPLNDDGTARRRFGRRGTGDGEFISPRAIAISPPAVATGGESDGAADASTRLVFVTDAGNHRVQVFRLDGEFVRAFGRRGAGPGEFLQPAGIAVFDNHVYVVDEATAQVKVFTADGRFERAMTGFGSKAGNLVRPVDVAVRADGRVFVVDADANRVQSYGPDGSPSESWGDWGSARGLLGEPTGIVIRPEGLYVTEWVNCRVSLFSPDGKLLMTWGAHALRPREGGGKLHYPRRCALSPAGDRAVICEPMENRCQVFGRYAPGDTIERVMPPSPDEISSHFGPRAATAADLAVLIDQEGRGIAVYDVTGRDGISLHRFGGVGDEPGNFRRPTAVALDSKGRKVAVADAGARRLSFFELERPEGPLRQLPNMSRFVRSISYEALDRRITPHVDGPPLDIGDLVLLGDGGIACLDGRRGRLILFDADLGFVRTIGDYGDRGGAFLVPETLALTPDGSGVWVVDSRRRCVQLFDLKSGDLQRSVGGDDAKLVEPFGVAVAGDGGLFVSDAAAATISRFDAAGKLEKRWGSAGLGAGEFAKPRDVMLDALGRLLVVDHGNHRVQIFTADGGFVSAFGARLFVVPTLKRPAGP